MDRRAFSRFGFGLFAGVAAASADAAEPKGHRVVFQIAQEERLAQQAMLGNVHNYAAYYRQKSEPFLIEIVAFGPGFSMVRGDMSMMKGEIETLQKDLGASLVITACHNSRAAVAATMGKKPEDIPLLPGVEETPSGVVRVAELQEQGWAYIAR